MNTLFTIYIKNLVVFFILILSLFTSAIIPQEKDKYIAVTKNLVALALKDRQGYQWLKELCEIGPRLSGSEKSYKAIEWAEAKMKKLG
ncbi:MAG: hypothetical protein EHM47_18475 [Ignavibacteriales bacterium]|nr:MAG: hypothetical protein EHM47_18475 [Ignavibacteriales bacterium]